MKIMGFGLTQVEFKFHQYHLLAGWLWENFFTVLSLSFLEEGGDSKICLRVVLETKLGNTRESTYSKAWQIATISL